jgi:hypothetical protein
MLQNTTRQGLHPSRINNLDLVHGDKVFSLRQYCVNSIYMNSIPFNPGIPSLPQELIDFVNNDLGKRWGKPSYMTLRSDLREQIDYEIITEQMWQELVNKYGGGPALARPLCSQGNFKVVELFPVAVHVKGQGTRYFCSSDTLRVARLRFTSGHPPHQCEFYLESNPGEAIKEFNLTFEQMGFSHLRPVRLKMRLL